PTTAGGAPTTAPERPVSLRRAPLARCPAQPFGPPRPQRIYLRQTRVAAAGGVVRQPGSLLPGAPDRHTWRAIRADQGTDSRRRVRQARRAGSPAADRPGRSRGLRRSGPGLAAGRWLRGTAGQLRAAAIQGERRLLR